MDATEEPFNLIPNIKLFIKKDTIELFFAQML